MITLAYFAGWIILTSLWLGRIGISWYRFERYAAGLSAGLLGGTWVDFAWSLFMPYSLSLSLSVLTLLILAAAFWRWPGDVMANRHLSKHQHLGWAIATGLPLLLLIVFNWNDNLRPATGGLYSGGSTWADLALHTSLITHFASLPHLDLSFSLVQNGKLTYHFMIDFLSSLLYRDHLSLRWAVLVPNILLSAAITQLLFFVPLRLFKNAKAAALGLYLFLFGGSTAGIYYFWQDWHASGHSLINFLSTFQIDYTSTFDKQLDFSNVITSALLPQRSSLFGFSIFLLVVCMLIARPGKKALWTIGILIGLLPLAHLHTFLAIGLVLASYTFYDLWSRRRWTSPYYITIIIALALALPQVAWLVTGGHHESFVTFKLGWMNEHNLLLFWLEELGLGLVFLAANIWFVRRRPLVAAFYLPLVVLFLIANLVQFQPSVYDNIKLFYYTYMSICFVAAAWMVQFAMRRRWAVIFVVLITLAWTATGLTSQLREWNTRTWLLEDNSSVAAAHAAEQLIPPTALVLTDTDHANPIAALAGRHILLGYEGWIGSYGLDYASTDQDIGLMLSGSDAAPALLQQYGINYVAIDSWQAPTWNTDTDYFTSHYPVIYQSGRWTIVQITPAPELK